MPLNSLVKAARNRTLPQKQKIKYKKQTPKFIDADKASKKLEEESKQTVCEDWRECKHLTEANNEYYCNHFMSQCAKEKCNGSMPLIGEKKH